MYGYEWKKKRLGQHFLLPSWGAKAKKVKGGVRCGEGKKDMIMRDAT